EEKAGGSTITREFDNAGRLVAQTDAAGRKTEFRLNIGSGNVTEIVTPDGRSVRFSYNDQRQLISTTGTDGLRSQQAFDALGRLTQEKSRHGDITRYFYDDPDNELPSAIEDATGSRKQMTWSRYGQLLTLTDCSGYRTRYEYNRFGQATALHQEEGLSQYRAYDERGRLVSQKDAAGHKTRYEYSMAGDLTTVVYPDGSRQTISYDAAGHPVSTTEGGLTRKMEYDAAGRVTRLVNENGADTTFTYDLPDRLAQETGFDGRTQRYQYSITGQLVRSEDENLITLWHYDASGRLAYRTVNDEEAERWQYNGRGWLTEISHLSDGHRVAVQYEYDKQGRMNLERQTVQHPETGELLWQHVTRHDYLKGLATRTTPDHLPSVEWLTYGSGYIAGVKPGNTPLVDFTRDRLHRETQRTSGAYEQNTLYGATGQLLSHTFSDPVLNRDTVITTTVSLCASVACIRRKTTAMTARGGSSAHATTTCCGATPPTRRATVLQTGNSTRRFPRCGGITASAKTCSIFTTTTRTEGWRKRMNAESAMAAATATIITTITSTVCATIAANNRVSRFWKAATCMTRWAAASENGCGKADVSAEASAERNIFT
ncbi:RHS repeat protein, partial [Salmonella bongori]|nr:RHS repeat protein [Salmonella bongori]